MFPVQVVELPESKCVRVGQSEVLAPPEAVVGVGLAHPNLVRTHKYAIAPHAGSGPPGGELTPPCYCFTSPVLTRCRSHCFLFKSFDRTTRERIGCAAGCVQRTHGRGQGESKGNAASFTKAVRILMLPCQGV